MRARLAVVVLALVASSCGASALGRTVVECDLEPDGLSATSIITAQSVPSADFIPCITALRPGWNFHHVAPESGRSWFALDSDRVGFRFLQVTLTKTCDVGDAEPVASDHPGAEHFVDVIEARDQLEV